MAAIRRLNSLNAMPVEDLFREFYEALGKFDFTLANRSLRQSTPAVANSSFMPAINALSRFSASESMYTSFAFLKKNFFKKDSLSLVYNSITEDLQKVVMLTNNSPTPASINGEFFSDLFNQTCLLIHVRQKLMAVYRLLAGPLSAPPDYRLLIASLEVLLDSNRQSFPHPYLAYLRMGFMLETSILICLFKAQLSISAYEFKDSAALLFKCKGYIDTWLHRLEAKTGKDQSVGPQAPHTLLWLSEFHGMLFAKMTLYFFNILTQLESESVEKGDIRTQSQRTEFDYYSAIKQFQRKTDAINVSLIFQVSSSPNERFHPEGYLPPSMPYSPPSGLQSFPSIFSLPQDKMPADHAPNVISIILDKGDELSITRDVPIKFHDAKARTIYFLTRIDPRVLLVLIFNDRPSTKEAAIAEFMNSLTNSLRNTQLFDKLNRF